MVRLIEVPNQKEEGLIDHLLFVGLGGAGQRHLRVFREMLPTASYWSAWSVCNSSPVLGPDGPIGGIVAEHYGLHTFGDLDEALAAKPDLVVVANPTDKHLDVVLRAVSLGLHVYCEKPLSHDDTRLNEVASICMTTGATCYTVQQRRHEPAMLRIRDLISSGEIGRLIHADFQVASNASSWRPWLQQQDFYAFRADLGGGVLSTECHEFDLCHWLFGAISSISASGGALRSDFGVEDTVEVLLSFASGMLMRLYLSFLDPDIERSVHIRGTLGALQWSARSGTLTWRQFGTVPKMETIPPLSQDDLYRREAQSYLDWRTMRPTHDTGIERGVLQARTIAVARQALRSGQRLPLACLGVKDTWPSSTVSSALATTCDVVIRLLQDRWQAIMAMGSLGYGGYVEGWSDIDIDVLMRGNEVPDPRLAALVKQTIHNAGFTQVDIRCYRLADLNAGKAPFPLGGNNRALMLKQSARVVAGTFDPAAVRQPTLEEMRVEGRNVLAFLVSKPLGWWEALPCDDVAAYIALPGRLLYTLKTGRVDNKFKGFNELLSLRDIIPTSSMWSAILWGLECRYSPAARDIPLPDVSCMAFNAAELALFVENLISNGWPH